MCCTGGGKAAEISEGINYTSFGATGTCMRNITYIMEKMLRKPDQYAEVLIG